MTLERCMDGPWRKSWRGALILGNYEWPGYWRRCTKGHIGQCRSQIGAKRAYRANSRLFWVPFAPWWRGNTNAPLGKFELTRIAHYPHPCA